MDFNFRDSFQAYSNVELLKIIDEADKYQPEAVEAARHILGGREVHDSDIEQMSNYKTAIAIQEKENGDASEELSNFLESIVKPEEGPNVGKWINVLLVLIGIQYLWKIPYFFRKVQEYLQCEQCSMLSGEFIARMYPFFYLPVTGYLLYKKKRWGWMLLMVYFLIATISQIGEISYYLYNYQSVSRFYRMDIIMAIVTLAAKAGVILFMWRPVVPDYFGISPRAKRDTLTIGISIGITVFVAMFVSIHTTSLR